MMTIDTFTFIFIIALFDIITLLITVAYCTHLINKKINMSINQDEIKEPKNKKKSPANKKKSTMAEKKNKSNKILETLFGLDDLYDFDEDYDTENKSLNYDPNEDVSDDELSEWISDEEIDDIVNETFYNKSKKSTSKSTTPLRGEKVVAFERPKIYYFNNPQDLVNYIANKDNRTVYDTKKNRMQKIKSFDLDYTGGLMIYYDYYDLPDYFEPGRFAKVS